MTGLEKIVSEIRGEAEKEAAEITAKGRARAEAVLGEARAESDARVARIEATAKQDVADIEQSRDSALALQRRQQTLAAKQELLGDTLQKALEALYGLEDDAYFGLLLKLAQKAAQPGQGEMLMNEKDKARMPQAFVQKLSSALPQGALLTVADATRPIDGGFVLKYGDVEENCSFKAMLNARADEFADLVRDTLFG